MYTPYALGCSSRIFHCVAFPSDTVFGPLAEVPHRAHLRGAAHRIRRLSNLSTSLLNAILDGTLFLL